MKIERFVGGSLESNCYVISIAGRGQCYIIDPGYEAKKIVNHVQNKGLKCLGVILTHHHHDHVGAADKVSDVLECPVMMSFEDSLMYKGKVDNYLQDGDVLILEDEEMKILATPGHTHGSICILCEKSRVIFTGDTIFDTDLGRTDLSDGSFEEMRKTCRNIIDRWHDSFRIYPGHDDSATMKQVRMYNKEFLDCLE